MVMPLYAPKNSVLASISGKISKFVEPRIKQARAHRHKQDIKKKAGNIKLLGYLSLALKKLVC